MSSTIVALATDPLAAAPRRTRWRRALSVAVLSAVAIAATACDTDDGRTLKTPSSQHTTTTPPPTTVPGGSAQPRRATSMPALVTGAPSTMARTPADEAAGGVRGAGARGVGGNAVQGDFFMSLPFEDGTNIPFVFTCRGDGVAPAVTFWNAGPDVVEMALVVVDEDADGFVHWVVIGIDPMARVVSGSPDPSGVQAQNDFGQRGWGPPCPPKGDGEHTYRFTMYGLDEPLAMPAGTPADEVIPRIEAAAVASATSTGTFRQ